MVWEAPLGSLVDVAVVQLAGGTAAIRFELCTPASLANMTAAAGSLRSGALASSAAATAASSSRLLLQ